MRTNLHRKKAAKLKVQIMEAALRLIGNKPFDDLHVEEICDKVKISKVTFFKYFPHKEDLLLYYFRLWCLKCSVELKSTPREGIAGIYYLADRLSEAYESHPGLILSLIGYLVDVKRPPKPFPVKPEEKELFYPDISGIAEIEILSLEQMVEKSVLEAVFRKEITRTGSTRDLTFLFESVLLGSIVTSHVSRMMPLKYYMRKHLDFTIRGLA
jgi:AcrR family transcriptional regulator